MEHYSFPSHIVNNTFNSLVSNIPQIDGLENSASLSSADECDANSENSSETDYDTEDKIEPEIEPVQITPLSKPIKRKLKVLQSSSLPLVAVLNARSFYNKADNFKIFIK